MKKASERIQLQKSPRNPWADHGSLDLRHSHRPSQLQLTTIDGIESANTQPESGALGLTGKCRPRIFFLPRSWDAEEFASS